MGRPRLDARRDPDSLPGGPERALREPIDVARPHVPVHRACRWATRTRSSSSTTRRDLRTLAESYGPRWRPRIGFPKRTNVEFARVRARSEIDLVVWERGSGITMACGTGACATVVAACLEERLAPGAETPRAPSRRHAGITVAKDYSACACAARRARVFEASIDVAPELGQ